jgi:uncharacterized protein (TIGR02452 family)
MSAYLRAMARETVAILEEGRYVSPSGRMVDLTGSIAQAVAGTKLFEPDEPVPRRLRTAQAPEYEVTNESTLSAAHRLGDGVACLVFASAKNPGGGFHNGAQAQEESIARASALYPCLLTCPQFYAHHRAQRDLLYSDRVIYSPWVPVFRNDDGVLLEQPSYPCLLTSAAPNAGAARRRQPGQTASLASVVRHRAARVLDIAAAYGHRTLVLGAWGCGVFGNEPHLVAEAFAAALFGRASFDRIVFAVLDEAPNAPTHAAFARVFGS